MGITKAQISLCVTVHSAPALFAGRKPRKMFSSNNDHMSGVMRKPAFCICKNKGADDDQLYFMAIFCCCTAQIVLDLVGNPENRFYHSAAHIICSHFRGPKWMNNFGKLLLSIEQIYFNVPVQVSPPIFSVFQGSLIFLAHLSQRLIGELIGCSWSGVRRRKQFQTSSTPKRLARSKPNFMWSLLG